MHDVYMFLRRLSLLRVQGTYKIYHYIYTFYIYMA